MNSADNAVRAGSAKPLAISIIRSIAAPKPKNTLSNLSALSKTLERDRAWLELNQNSRERQRIEKELLAKREEDETEAAEPAPISRDAYSNYVAKETKNGSRFNFLRRMFGDRMFYPAPIGAAMFLMVAGSPMLTQTGFGLVNSEAQASVIKKQCADQGSGGKKDTTHSDVQSAFSAQERAQLSTNNVSVLQSTAYKSLASERTDFAIALLTKAIHLAPNDATNRRLMAYSLIQAKLPNYAVQQLYVWEQLSSVKPDDEMAFANALAKASFRTNSQSVFDHIIRRFGENPEALLRVAQDCSKFNFRNQTMAAIRSGFPLASGPQRAEYVKVKQFLDMTAPITPPRQIAERPIYKG
ncbi:MAG TPA: hypothetical protein V6C97_10005 [Oculatellaceae cyanobacterium]